VRVPLHERSFSAPFEGSGRRGRGYQEALVDVPGELLGEPSVELRANLADSRSVSSRALHVDVETDRRLGRGCSEPRRSDDPIASGLVLQVPRAFPGSWLVRSATPDRTEFLGHGATVPLGPLSPFSDQVVTSAKHRSSRMLLYRRLWRDGVRALAASAARASGSRRSEHLSASDSTIANPPIRSWKRDDGDLSHRR
jgi:hypothetical protein